nr:MAG TPA: hypothetical protein [Caudoviricetes sp.]
MVKEACEKYDYELYKKACCLLHMYVKLCSESEEERACFALFNALSNEKSQFFLNVVRQIVKAKHMSNGDTLLYGLLLSVRIHDEFIVAFLLKECDMMQSEFLNMLVEEEKSEKRE